MTKTQFVFAMIALYGAFIVFIGGILLVFYHLVTPVSWHLFP